MGERSSIEWTDATWNPVVGCKPVSEGCRNCYAARLAATRMKNHPSRAGLARVNAVGRPVFTGELRVNEAWIDQPLRWRRPRRIFVGAHSDIGLWPDWVLDRVFDVMKEASHHTYQLLSKRPWCLRKYLLAHEARRLPNVQIGVSVECNDRVEELVPDLRATPAAHRFISIEPLLGPVSLGLLPGLPSNWWLTWLDDLHQVIIGGESGPGARPCDLAWIRHLVDECRQTGTPVLIKQLGANVVEHGKPLKLRHGKGADPAEWPEDLRPYGVAA